MRNDKKIIFLMMICMLSLALVLSAEASSEAFNWYCMRNKNHCQPRCEPDMSFIEEYGGYYVDKKLKDYDTVKRIYLTFDAGYENGNVEKVLDILKDKNVPAAFFILSNIVKTNTDLVRRMVNEGHTVCNHTSTHKDMTKIKNFQAFSAELKKLEDVYRDHTGFEISKYYRPPEGRFSRQSMEYASELGYKTIFWSFAYADWDNNNQPAREKALKLIFDNIHNGAVILLHPTSSTNCSILPEIIERLSAEGYTFGTLDELTCG